MRIFYRYLRRRIYRALHFLDVVGKYAIRTRLGAILICNLVHSYRPLICTNCLSNHGLRLNAERVAVPLALSCPHCGERDTKKLTHHLIQHLARQFFERGSMWRPKQGYGDAPLIAFNEMQPREGDYEGDESLRDDVALLSEKGRIRFFHYAPNLWMLGEVEPLKDLINPCTRMAVIDRVLEEYPERILPHDTILYRLRIDPRDPDDYLEYDSPPINHVGDGRLDSKDLPVLYCSDDIDTCIHECRVTAEDDLYLAALIPRSNLRLLDLTVILPNQDGETEFESLDTAINMLFHAARHSYEISRDISRAANQAGFDGLLYPSFFNKVRTWQMPNETIYGRSLRRIPQFHEHIKAGTFSNVALFGRPIREDILKVVSVNRLVIHTVSYDFRFGPTPKQIDPNPTYMSQAAAPNIFTDFLSELSQICKKFFCKIRAGRFK